MAKVLVVTVELIGLLFLNIFSFNFNPTPNKSLRFTRFRKSYINQSGFVLTNYYQSNTAILLDVRFLKWPRSFFFCSCLSPMIVHVRNVEHTCCSNIANSKEGKQTKGCEIVIDKYIKTNTHLKLSTPSAAEQRFLLIFI